MLLVTVTASVALAVTKTCNGVPCKGTDNEDVLHERKRHDRILGYGDRGDAFVNCNVRSTRAADFTDDVE
jgi:hypothetical protein